MPRKQAKRNQRKGKRGGKKKKTGGVSTPISVSLEKRIIKGVFDEGKSMLSLSRDLRKSVSYNTIRKVINAERERRQQGILLPTPPRRKVGRPSVFSIQDVENIYDVVREHRAKGDPFSTREEILQAAHLQVKKHPGDAGIYPQRLSELKGALELTKKKPRPTKTLPPRIITRRWLQRQRKSPRIDKHWFDEKPLWSNAVPDRSWGLRKRPLLVRKTKSVLTRYTLISICNVSYGVKLLGLIKHDEGKGTNRNLFLRQCAELIKPVLQEHQQKRGGKEQVLYLDRAGIHMDKKNHQFHALFAGVARIEYLPSYPAHHCNPLDHSIFGRFQQLFNREFNSTAEEVQRAVDAVFATFTPKMVESAVKDLGY